MTCEFDVFQKYSISTYNSILDVYTQALEEAEDSNSEPDEVEEGYDEEEEIEKTDEDYLWEKEADPTYRPKSPTPEREVIDLEEEEIEEERKKETRITKNM